MTQQPNFNERIQVDTSDEDSIFETDSLLDSNLSFASSIRDYCYENGRRYHAYRPGQYPFPNDQEEQERLALMHHLFKMLTGGDLYRAPIPRDTEPNTETGTGTGTRTQTCPPRRFLDIGTGTAEWAVEMAEAFPNAEVIGTDLSPIQPTWSPPNCRFFIDDIESDWAYSPSEAFDYIHARSMGGGVADWPRLLRQAFQHLKPGGWVEIQEFETIASSDDGSHNEAKLLNQWLERLTSASIQFGKPVNHARQVATWMEECGFQNVTDDTYKCPIGGWAKDRRLKEIGRIGRVSIIEAVEPYTLALFTRILGWKLQEAQEFMDRVRKEMANNKYHVYVFFHFIYGQRPMETETDQTQTPVESLT
ncbi:hypothetical protein N7495_005436 [Penicillium taxi]|uniref:uncharacterized protein n=1 Tax=Penicillium taxi TaxID=168475 RepID=UPI002545AD1D|nr:uncharacterized protein N7495_005436 [Penicillium taxi]KAJ5893745.1 hypothetical protein N7495_005436 [Penicillium taxi]